MFNGGALNVERRINFTECVSLSRLEASAASGTASNGGQSPGGLASIKVFVSSFWKFLRPHTIRGTLLGSITLTARALVENPALLDWSLLPTAMLGVLALLCGNGYIVGINQIFDVEIDEVHNGLFYGKLPDSLLF